MFEERGGRVPQILNFKSFLNGKLSEKERAVKELAATWFKKRNFPPQYCGQRTFNKLWVTRDVCL
jgi:hypothetical protein